MRWEVKEVKEPTSTLQRGNDDRIQACDMGPGLTEEAGEKSSVGAARSTHDSKCWRLVVWLWCGAVEMAKCYPYVAHPPHARGDEDKESNDI